MGKNSVVSLMEDSLVPDLEPGMNRMAVDLAMADSRPQVDYWDPEVAGSVMPPSPVWAEPPAFPAPQLSGERRAEQG